MRARGEQRILGEDGVGHLAAPMHEHVVAAQTAGSEGRRRLSGRGAAEGRQGRGRAAGEIGRIRLVGGRSAGDQREISDLAEDCSLELAEEVHPNPN